MEIVIVEKKTFEALLSGVETLVGKVGALCRCCNDKQMQKWLDGGGGVPPVAHKPPHAAIPAG